MKILKCVIVISIFIGFYLGLYTCSVKYEEQLEIELKECQRLCKEIMESIKEIKDGGPIYSDGGYYLIIPNDYWTPFSCLDDE